MTTPHAPGVPHARRGAFAAAAASFEQERELGRPLWSTDQFRAYERQDGDIAQMTITSATGPALTYRLIGVELEDL